MEWTTKQQHVNLVLQAQINEVEAMQAQGKI